MLLIICAAGEGLLQQVPGWEQKAPSLCSGVVCDLEGSSVCAAPSQRIFPQGKLGSCSVKSLLLLSAHADHEVPLQVGPLSWSAGVQIFVISHFSPAASWHEDRSKGLTLVVLYSVLLPVCLRAAAALLGHLGVSVLVVIPFPDHSHASLSTKYCKKWDTLLSLVLSCQNWHANLQYYLHGCKNIHVSVELFSIQNYIAGLWATAQVRQI